MRGRTSRPASKACPSLSNILSRGPLGLYDQVGPESTIRSYDSKHLECSSVIGIRKRKNVVSIIFSVCATFLKGKDIFPHVFSCSIVTETPSSFSPAAKRLISPRLCPLRLKKMMSTFGVVCSWLTIFYTVISRLSMIKGVSYLS